MEYDDTHHAMRGDLQAESSVSKFQSPGAGVYFGGPTADRTACISLAAEQ